MLDVKRGARYTSRGRWCNLCGSRLAGSRASLPFAHQLRRADAPDRASQSAAQQEPYTWSICSQCYHKRLRCATCSIPVGAEAFMLRGEGDFYCAQCFWGRPRCDTCDRPVGQQYWSRPDGRTLCSRCQSTAICDPASAYHLYGRVSAALARQLGMALREPCSLKLVSHEQLLRLMDKVSLHNLDADSRGRCFGLFMRQGSEKAIIIEYGLPQIVLLEVIAHEFAHAWQSENCPTNTSHEVQEGFAEWVAFKLLSGWGCTRRSDRMLRRDDMYGRGLKRVLRWEAEGGTAEVFQRVSNG